jgi:hypothetical protein
MKKAYGFALSLALVATQVVAVAQQQPNNSYFNYSFVRPEVVEVPTIDATGIIENLSGAVSNRSTDLKVTGSVGKYPLTLTRNEHGLSNQWVAYVEQEWDGYPADPESDEPVGYEVWSISLYGPNGAQYRFETVGQWPGLYTIDWNPAIGNQLQARSYVLPDTLHHEIVVSLPDGGKVVLISAPTEPSPYEARGFYRL